MDFREFIDLTHGPALRTPNYGPKLWKAKEADVLKMWRELRPNMPVMMQPVSKQHRGSRYAEDGIRITGTSRFITSVLGKLKDILNYESPNMEIEVEYRQIQDKKGVNRGLPKFVFYAHLKEKDGGSDSAPAPPELP